MGTEGFFWLLRGLLLALCSDFAVSYQLEPIDALALESAHKIARRNSYDRSNLDLLSSETFLWGGMFISLYPGFQKLIRSV